MYANICKALFDFGVISRCGQVTEGYRGLETESGKSIITAFKYLTQTQKKGSKGSEINYRYLPMFSIRCVNKLKSK